jgi:3-oxoacyl-[acyl-carrier protein] reductase
MEFKDKVVIVTGGTRGIGMAIAGEFCLQGARVSIIGRNPITLRATAESIATETGQVCIPIAGDVGKMSDMRAVFFEVLDTFGCLVVCKLSFATN